MRIICPHCGRGADKKVGAINRARGIGAPVYCSRKCAGLAKRKGRSAAERKEAKRVYDAEYRRINLAKIKAAKAARFRATYDPIQAAKDRKKTMARHVEYCRRPKYKKYKSAYDQRYRAVKTYGEFSEAYLALLKLNRHVAERISDYESGQENGRYEKIQERRRKTQGRRRDHSAAHS